MQVINAYWKWNNLFVFHRNEKDKVVKTKLKAEHSCFIPINHRKSDLLKSRKIVETRVEGDYLRLVFSDRDILKRVTAQEGAFSQHSIPTFEADVSPVRRFLTDNEITIQRPKICYLDLETDSRCKIVDIIEGKGRILCWSVADEDANIVGYGYLKVDSDESECEMLREIWDTLFKFDLVAGWNADDFDFPVLKNRTFNFKLKLNDDVRRLLYLDHLQIFKRMNITAAKTGDEKQSFALNSVANAVLGFGKKEFNTLNTWNAWKEGGKALEDLVEYNKQDTRLMPLIEKKTGYIEIHLTICESCFTLPDSRGAKPTNFVEGYLLKFGSKKGVRFKTKHYSGDSLVKDKFAGALVTEPVKGIHKSVHVCDFASMYPSIIRSFNMSPETFGSGDCISPKTNVRFRTDIDGILPQALADVMAMRDYWKKVKASSPPGSPEWVDANRRTSGFKVTANSFYGVIGCPYSRFMEREIAESVTQVGVWLLEKTQEFAESFGYHNVYSDTDSVMITGLSDDEFQLFVKKCNEELFPRLLKECGATRNYLKIAYDKKFRRLIFVAKKRYCGSIEHSERIAPKEFETEIKGMSIKRGDSLKLGRLMQTELVEILLKDECEQLNIIEEFIKRWKLRVLEGEFKLEDIVMSKKISRALDAYITKEKKDGTMSLPPAHVRVAKILIERGYNIPEGQRVEYIVTDSYKGIKAIPAEDYDNNVDRHYLWQNLTFPPSRDLLVAAFPDNNWKRFQKSRPRYVPPEQMKLF